MAQENNNVTQNARCPQNCRMCSMQQRSYCSSQMSLYMLGTLQDMVAEIKAMRDEVAQIKTTCADNENGFIEITQKGSGVETIDSQDNQLFTT